MPDTSSREGFKLRLFLNGNDTSIYSYDLGWVDSLARSQGFELTPEKMLAGLATVRKWWGHALECEPCTTVSVPETPLKYEIALLEGESDAGKVECKIEIGTLQVTWLWDPVTDKISTSSRAAFRLSPAGFDWYLNVYGTYLDAIQRVRGEIG